MQGRIADELDRADLTTEIQNAIQDSIGFYERKYFYFTNSPAAFVFNTVAGQEYYTTNDNPAISTSNEITALTGTFFGWRRQLHKRTWKEIDRISWLQTSKAQPVLWAYMGESIRMYPIPDNTYPVSCAATGRPMRPAANTDAGPWMNDAEALIRTKAKIYLMKNVIRSSDMLEELRMLEGPDGKGGQLADEYAALTGETALREARGSVVPSQF